VENSWIAYIWQDAVGCALTEVGDMYSLTEVATSASTSLEMEEAERGRHAGQGQG